MSISKQVKENVNKIITSTFAIIQNVYDKQKEVDGKPNEDSKSRIIFPKKRDMTTRVSEQELRFIFIEQLNKKIQEEGWNVYYSVETPTKDCYVFTKKKNDTRDVPRIAEKDENGKPVEGQSASFDLVIHDANYKRIALIEFKANNASKHEKDFCKLNNEIERKEDDVIAETFFVEILKASDKNTYDSLKGKIKDYKGIFRCYSLGEKSEITKKIIKR